MTKRLLNAFWFYLSDTKQFPVSLDTSIIYLEERRFWNSPSRSNHGFGRDAYQANSTNKNTTPSQVKHRITTSIRPRKELCGDERTDDAKQTTGECGQTSGRPSHGCRKCFRCPTKQLWGNNCDSQQRGEGCPRTATVLTTALKRLWKKYSMALNPTWLASVVTML